MQSGWVAQEVIDVTADRSVELNDDGGADLLLPVLTSVRGKEIPVTYPE